MDDYIKQEEEKITMEITKQQARDFAYLISECLPQMATRSKLRWIYGQLKLCDEFLKAAGMEGLEGSYYG